MGVDPVSRETKLIEPTGYQRTRYDGENSSVNGEEATGRDRLKECHGRGTSASKKTSVLGSVKRDGLLVSKAFNTKKRVTIKAHICDHMPQGTVVNTDEYTIYNKLEQWGHTCKTVRHSDGEYACDDGGDGINEVHAATTSDYLTT